jgi:hypothetical protein
VGTVKQYTRTRNGRTETVHRHTRSDEERAQDKRDAFERRVLRERQAARRGKTNPGWRRPGERHRKPKATPARAKRYAKRAWRSRKRHKARCFFYTALALGTLAVWGGRKTGRAAKSAWQRYWREAP